MDLPAIIPSKPFCSYADLVALLLSRGMGIECPVRAQNDLARLGYYRLSGFWYTARAFLPDGEGQAVTCPLTRKPLRLERFQPGTHFDDVIALYRFDKALRLLMLDAIETVEVHLKTVFAHELGRNDAMAYTSAAFVDPKWTRAKDGGRASKWEEWRFRQAKKLAESREDALQWHRLSGRAIPFWVAVEAWDFGTLSMYFQLLKRKPQAWILARLGLADAKVFQTWLREINTLRNRCAHHTRIWNQSSSNPIALPEAEDYFHPLDLDSNARRRLLGLVAVLGYLLRQIDPESMWLHRVADVIDRKPSLPGCTFAALGIRNEGGFPRGHFGI